MKAQQLIKTTVSWLLIIAVICLPLTISAYSEDDLVKVVEQRQKELQEKETLLKKEEERINVLRKDVDERIEKYTALLKQLEDILNKLGKAKEENLTHVVKAYEAMPPEEAALKLSVIDENTAVMIITNMKSKKAGAVLALMESQKAATLTKHMLDLKKDLPKETNL